MQHVALDHVAFGVLCFTLQRQIFISLIEKASPKKKLSHVLYFILENV